MTSHCRNGESERSDMTAKNVILSDRILPPENPAEILLADSQRFSLTEFSAWIVSTTWGGGNGRTCEREDASFFSVAAVVRRRFATSTSSESSSAEPTLNSDSCSQASSLLSA
jgi:hypothetical protein